MYRTRADKFSDTFGFAWLVFMIAFALTCAAAFITHVVVAIQWLTSGMESIAYGILLALGILCPPVGVIHGIGVWFGAW